MSFSEKWEDAYAQNKHYSIWPWSNLISTFYKVYDRTRPQDVLELGCGAGANIPFFRSLENVNYYAVDGSPTAIQYLISKFPDLSQNLKAEDFSKSFGFNKQFDIIFDRAALTCNRLSGVEACLKRVDEHLKPGGFFIGIDWYSTRSTFAKLGKELCDNGNTRHEYNYGPFKDVEPVHFFDQAEIVRLFQGYQLIHLQHTDSENFDLSANSSQHHTAWNFIFRKSLN